MATRRRLGGKVLTKKVLEIEGIPEMTSKVNRVLLHTGGQNGRAVAKEIKQALMTGALIMRDEARDLVPVDTGLLRSAIFAAYGDDRKPDVLFGVNTRVAVKTTAAGTKTYAGVVEFGDDSHAPQPYMRPAVQATRGIVARTLKEGLTKAIEKITDRS